MYRDEHRHEQWTMNKSRGGRGRERIDYMAEGEKGIWRDARKALKGSRVVLAARWESSLLFRSLRVRCREMDTGMHKSLFYHDYFPSICSETCSG